MGLFGRIWASLSRVGASCFCFALERVSASEQAWCKLCLCVCVNSAQCSQCDTAASTTRGPVLSSGTLQALQKCARRAESSTFRGLRARALRPQQAQTQGKKAHATHLSLGLGQRDQRAWQHSTVWPHKTLAACGR